MPQASDELRAKFPGSDTQALFVLFVNFTWSAGMIRKKDRNYKPTEREYDAIDYLVFEWDFAYEPVERMMKRYGPNRQ